MYLKKNTVWVIGIVGVLAVYGGFRFLSAQNDAGSAPVITFEEDNLEVSVKATTEDLLAGVHAEDAEDGNLDEDIVVDTISAFDEDKNRTVTYAVFDSDRNVTKVSRKIHYTDYTKCTFSLTQSFSGYNLNTSTILSLIHASSPVDCDVTNKIVYDIASSSDDPNIMNVSLSVKDSTGETSTLELEYTYDSNDYTTDIGLKQYLVYVRKGGSFDAEDNVNTVDSKSLPDEEEAIDQLNIDDSDVDYDQPGVYEITYSFNYYGDNGFAKCIVVVE